MKSILYVIQLSFLCCLWGLLYQGCDPTLPLEKPCKTDEQCNATEDGASRFLCIDARCRKLRDCAVTADCKAPKERCFRKKCVPNAPCQNGDCPGAQICQGNFCIEGAFSPSTALLHMRFDEQGVTKTHVKDSSTFGHHGTWQKSASYSPDGYIQRASVFQDANSIQIKRTTNFEVQRFTLSVWVKRTSKSTGGNVFRIVDSEFRNGYGLDISKEGTVRFYVADDNNRHDCISPKPLPVGRWVHLAGSFDGIQVRCFVGGSLVASVPWDGQVTYGGSTQPVRIGGPSISEVSRSFTGQMDELLLLPEPRKTAFLPNLKRFMYVASKDAKRIVAVDIEQDAPAPSQSFVSPVKDGWPIALGESGKYLYMWEPTTSKVHRIDVLTHKSVASVRLLQERKEQVIRASWSFHSTKENELWIWGERVYVLSALFADGKQPVALREGFSASFASDVAWLPAYKAFAVTDSETNSLHLFDAQKNAYAFRYAMTGRCSQPLALAALADGKELRVSCLDSHDLNVLSLLPKTLQLKGALSIQETFESPTQGTVTKPRRIRTMIGLSKKRFLFYTFDEKRYIYQMDVQTRLQHLLDTWPDPTDPLKEKKNKIKPLLSLYWMHLHALGHKLYIQDGNTGRWLVVRTDKRSIVKEFSISSMTLKKPLPMVGVQNRSQAY